MMGIQELRLRLKERVSAVQDGIHTVFTRHGRPVAVLVDIDWYRRAVDAIGDAPLGFENPEPLPDRTWNDGS